MTSKALAVQYFYEKKNKQNCCVFSKLIFTYTKFD